MEMVPLPTFSLTTSFKAVIPGTLIYASMEQRCSNIFSGSKHLFIAISLRNILYVFNAVSDNIAIIYKSTLKPLREVIRGLEDPLTKRK
jgi:hypothetical protein